MASLATLRANVLIFLGTNSNDKAFPTATLDVLIQNAVNKTVSDIEEMSPGFTRTVVTLTGTDGSHSYTLASDFSRALDVRITDSEGVKLREVRDDELNSFSGYTFTITGSDHLATLVTGPTVEEGADLYFKYRAWPADLSLTTDVPETIPRKFHDVIALEAAKVGFGLGGEQAFPAVLQDQLDERRAQLFAHCARRSVDVATVRDSQSSYDTD